jgi:hypothetical protein
MMKKKKYLHLPIRMDSQKPLAKMIFFEAISFRNDCLPEFIKKAMPSNAMIKFSKRT